MLYSTIGAGLLLIIVALFERELIVNPFLSIKLTFVKLELGLVEAGFLMLETCQTNALLALVKLLKVTVNYWPFTLHVRFITF